MTPIERAEEAVIAMRAGPIGMVSPRRSVEIIAAAIADAVAMEREEAVRAVEALAYPAGPLSAPAVHAAVRAIRSRP